MKTETFSFTAYFMCNVFLNDGSFSASGVSELEVG